jgi:hypothetical protein
VRALAAGAVALALVAACRAEAPRPLEERAEGMPAAVLDLAGRVAVYDAAMRKSFDLGPGILLQLHPRLLPRTGGFEGGAQVDSALVVALKAANLVRGVCEPARDGDLRAPRCNDTQAGYVVRGSEIFQRGADTVQFFLHAEVFAPTKGPGTSPFDFEMAYRLAPRSEDRARYRVVAEGRVRQKGG